MKRFGQRCAMALVAGCLALAAARGGPATEVRRRLATSFAMPVMFGGYPCTGDAALSEFQQLGTATILMVNRIRDWMIESDKNTKALQEDVKGLKKDVAELKEAVARLQQGTPPGTPKPPDEARISALEARVAKLEAERNAVRAPFRVLDAAGQALLTLDIQGNLAVGKPGGSKMLFTHQEDGKATLGVDSADGHVAALMATDGGHLVLSNSKSGARVEASAGETPAISVSDPSQSVEMGIGQDLFGLKLSAGDKPAAVLGHHARPRRGPAPVRRQRQGGGRRRIEPRGGRGRPGVRRQRRRHQCRGARGGERRHRPRPGLQRRRHCSRRAGGQGPHGRGLQQHRIGRGDHRQERAVRGRQRHRPQSLR